MSFLTELLQKIAAFASGNSVWVYLFIFIGKLVEVTFGTLRIVLINRGERTAGTIISFVEIMLWLTVASCVLDGFREDFLKGVIYGLAFAFGNYFGSWLDEKLAFGISSLQVVVPDAATAASLSEQLRAKGFGITSLDVHGRSADHNMLIMSMKRKRSAEAIALIEKLCPEAVISISDIKVQRGGYLHDRVKSGPLRIGK